MVSSAGMRTISSRSSICFDAEVSRSLSMHPIKITPASMLLILHVPGYQDIYSATLCSVTQNKTIGGTWQYNKGEEIATYQSYNITCNDTVVLIVMDETGKYRSSSKQLICGKLKCKG